MGNTSSQVPSGDASLEFPDMLPVGGEDTISSSQAADLLLTHLKEEPDMVSPSTSRKSSKKHKKGKKRPREEQEQHEDADLIRQLVSQPEESSTAVPNSSGPLDQSESKPHRSKKKKSHKRHKKDKSAAHGGTGIDDAHVDPALTEQREPALFLEDLVDVPDTGATVTASSQPDLSSNLASLATAAALAAPPEPVATSSSNGGGPVRASDHVTTSEEQTAAQQKKSHTFTQSDINAIDRYVQDVYIPRHNTTRAHVCSKIQHKTPKAAAEKEEISNLWKELFEVLPHRTPRSIRRFCRRRFHNYIKGPWSQEEEEQLARAYQAKPNKWAAISEELGRSDEDCRDRWRNYVSLRMTQNKDKWSADEKDALIKAVGEGAQRSRAAAVQKSRESGTPFEEKDWNSMVNWDVVSEKLGRRRSRLQCLQKWHKMERAKRNKARKAAIKAMTATPDAVEDNLMLTTDMDEDVWDSPPSHQPYMDPDSSSLQQMAAAAAAQRESDMLIDDSNNMFAEANLKSVPGRKTGPGKVAKMVRDA